ncbi:MAG: hypothetical protein MUE35_01735, partial [Hydrogenophaga sp.]|nr:hypothetical protein [Hydrogenophaga sp.]
SARENCVSGRRGGRATRWQTAWGNNGEAKTCSDTGILPEFDESVDNPTAQLVTRLIGLISHFHG